MKPMIRNIERQSPLGNNSVKFSSQSLSFGYNLMSHSCFLLACRKEWV